MQARDELTALDARQHQVDEQQVGPQPPGQGDTGDTVVGHVELGLGQMPTHERVQQGGSRIVGCDAQDAQCRSGRKGSGPCAAADSVRRRA